MAKFPPKTWDDFFRKHGATTPEEKEKLLRQLGWKIVLRRGRDTAWRGPGGSQLILDAQTVAGPALEGLQRGVIARDSPTPGGREGSAEEKLAQETEDDPRIN